MNLPVDVVVGLYRPMCGSRPKERSTSSCPRTGTRRRQLCMMRTHVWGALSSFDFRRWLGQMNCGVFRFAWNCSRYQLERWRRVGGKTQAYDYGIGGCGTTLWAATERTRRRGINMTAALLYIKVHVSAELSAVLKSNATTDLDLLALPAVIQTKIPIIMAHHL